MSITLAELEEVVRELFVALDKDKSNFLEKNEVLEIASSLHGKISGDSGNKFN